MKSLPGVNLSHWDFTFLLRAQRASLSSKDPRRQVGAVVVYADNTTAGDGFNGLAPGVDDARIHDRAFKNNCVLHAEENALLSCKGDVTGGTLYVWGLTPCGHCAAVAIRKRVKRIVGVFGPGGDSWVESLEHAAIEMRDANVKFECLGMDVFDGLMREHQPELHKRHFPHEYGLPKFWPGCVDADSPEAKAIATPPAEVHSFKMERNAMTSHDKAPPTEPVWRMYCRSTPASRVGPDASGIDLRADLIDMLGSPSDFIVLATGERRMISTGVHIALPRGLEGQVRPRSGLAAKHGITVVNSPGTIDCDYRGEIKVVLLNTGNAPFRIEHGDRIAQLVISPVFLGDPALVASVEELGSTERDGGGFGSTGVK